MMHIMTEQDKNDFLKIKGWVYLDPNTLEHRIPNDAHGYVKKAFERLKKGALMFE